MADLPHLIRPMLVSLRHALPEDEDRYGWELKWDGLRAIAYVSAGKVRLVSRNDKDMAPSYPELGVLAERVRTPVILDGEIVVLRAGRPNFGLLQSRMHVQQPDDKLIRAAPVQYYVFDLLHEGEESLLDQPYTERRARLEALGLDANPVRTPPWHRGGAAQVLADSIAKGLEGVVGKPLTSTYHPGQRRDWIKVKNVRQQEVIVGGWKPGGAARGHDRLPAARRLRRRQAAVRGPRRHRLHPGHADRADARARAAGPRQEPVRHPGTGRACPRRPLGRTPAGRRGGVRRVDHRRDPAPAQLAGNPDRKNPEEVHRED